jgi:hypothetical protein
VLTPHPSWWADATALPDENVLAVACDQLGVDLHLLHPAAAHDSTQLSALITAVKRAMAAEYVRELSTRTLANAKRLGSLGAHLGGKPGFGYRRMLVDQDGHHLGLLEHGTRKTHASQHVILVPGPDDEIALVNWMYRQVAEEDQSITQLVQRLAMRGAVTDQGRSWTRATVLTVLTSPRYIGTLVYNRTNTHLGGRRRRNAPSEMVCISDAFAGIVPQAVYHQVQDALAERGEIKR